LNNSIILHLFDIQFFFKLRFLFKQDRKAHPASVLNTVFLNANKAINYNSKKRTTDQVRLQDKIPPGESYNNYLQSNNSYSDDNKSKLC